jgi:hypothetical protein
LTTYYEPVPENQFASGFKPNSYHQGIINQIIFERMAAIAAVAFDWSEEAMIYHQSSGFGMGDVLTAYRNAFKGKRGYSVSKWEAYKDPNPACEFNTRFTVKVEGDGWWTRLVVVSVVEFGESYDDDEDEIRLSDHLQAVAIFCGMNADDADAFGKMARWWTTVNPSKAEG